MPKQFELLSSGLLLVIVAIVLILYWVKVIGEWGQIISLIIAFYGIWTVVLAGIRVRYPEKYGRGAYSTLVMGILLVAFGGAWYLYSATLDLLMSIVLLLIVIGILAVASALPSLRQKE